MKLLTRSFFAALAVLAPACFAQKWEVGGVTGGGFSNTATVSSAQGSASAGLADGVAFGAIFGQNLYPHISGEMHYLYRFSDLHLANGSDSATFKGMSHSFHYDILIHSRSERSRVQPFAAAGGGFRVFRGIGTESAFQPLSSFALLTKTAQWSPLATFGGGIKYAIASRVVLRIEVRDYFSSFPTKVIAPAPGARLSGWLHDIVPMAGITFLF